MALVVFAGLRLGIMADKIIVPVEKVLEFGEVARQMLVTDGTISAGAGAFDAAS